MTAKPPRDERKHSKVWTVKMSKDEMDVLAAVAGRYFDSMSAQKIVLPPKISLDALTALNKFKRAIRDDSPMVMIDSLPLELQEAGAAIEGGARLQTDAIDDAIASPGIKSAKQILDELERRVRHAREEAQRVKDSAPGSTGASMAIGYLEGLKEIRDWIIGGMENGERLAAAPIAP